jgi:hypothetical protein
VADALEQLVQGILASQGPVAHGTASATDQGIFSKLTDASLYTGGWNGFASSVSFG